LKYALNATKMRVLWLLSQPTKNNKLRAKNPLFLRFFAKTPKTPQNEKYMS
jgi:hypothetical protein